MTREEAIYRLKNTAWLGTNADREETEQAVDMAIEALKNEPILCEDCRHRNTWDNPRLDPQYYRCGKGVKFRDYGYVREDDYCPFGERREESEVEEGRQADDLDVYRQTTESRTVASVASYRAVLRERCRGSTVKYVQSKPSEDENNGEGRYGVARLLL